MVSLCIFQGCEWLSAVCVGVDGVWRLKALAAHLLFHILSELLFLYTLLPVWIPVTETATQGRGNEIS